MTGKNNLLSIITVFPRSKMFFSEECNACLFYALGHLHCEPQRTERTCILGIKHPSNKADSHHTKVPSSNKPSVTQLPGEFCVEICFSFSSCTTCCYSLNFKNDQRPIKHDLRAKIERIGVV